MNVSPAHREISSRESDVHIRVVDVISAHLPISQLRDEVQTRFEGGRAFTLTQAPPHDLPRRREIWTASNLDFAVLQRTSGTTGRPREFVFTRAAVSAHAKVTADVMGVSGRDPVALAITPGTAYYMSVLMMAIISGAPLTVLNPLNVREAIDRIKSEQFQSMDAGVRFWQTIGHLARRDPNILHALRTIPIRGVGGDLLPESTENYYREWKAPLTNGYGLTQAGPNIAIGVHATPGILGSCGFPLPNVKLAIVDRELRVQTPYAASAEVIDNHAKPIPEMTVHGWLRTGDRAALVAGQLIPKGRLVHVNGGNS